MYKASIGYCFTPWAFYLDKFALSFGNEKYKYNGEPDFVPPLEKFPGITGGISTGTVRNPFVDKIE